jgi:hypothetical protein
MTVYVNGKEILILPGMSVKHALIGADLLGSIDHKKIYDEWGNELGLDGALQEGIKLFVR